MTFAIEPDEGTLPNGNETISVVNTAALTAYVPLAAKEGVRAWVQSLRCAWVLMPAGKAPAPVAGLLRVVGSSLGAGWVWVRQPTGAYAWSQEAIWHVANKAGGGNNENPGNVPGAPLETIEEWAERLPGLTLPDYTVTAQTDIASWNVGPQTSIGAGSRVKFKFTPTIAASGEVTAITTPNVGNNNLPATLQVSGIVDWTPYIESVLETTLPSGALAWSAVGWQTAAPVAETGPWITSVVVTIPATFAFSGASAAPAVAATVRVLSLLRITAASVTLNGSKDISYSFETVDARSVNDWLGTCRQVCFVGCQTGAAPTSATVSATGQAIYASGCVTKSGATQWFPNGVFRLYGLVCRRTGVALTADTNITCYGAQWFGAAFTCGNQVSGQGGVFVQTSSGGGSASGLAAHHAVADATYNPGADGIVIRSGAYLAITGGLGLYGVQAVVAGSVGVRAWGGGQVWVAPGLTPSITGALADYAIGNPTPATIVPPILVGGAVPAALAIAAGAGNGWNQWNTPSPTGWGRDLSYAGSRITGAQ